MKNAKLNWVRLPLKGIENCRELGGYSTQVGQQTKWHTFLRSSDMSKLTKDDIKFLEDYGVKTIIDLRGIDELATHKNPLAEENFCDYHNIPLITTQVSDITFSTALEMSIGKFYVDLLEQNDMLKKIFDVIGHAEEGGIIFHCQAGKDRTGLLAMLLLGLVGVEKKDIVSNYEVTYSNLESMHNLETVYENVPKEFLYSTRDNIILAYDYIIQNYQSFDQYLLSKNVDQDVIDKVKERLLHQEETVIL
ncbi:tyrosine-protein phosphatase [Bacillus sp. B1-b2]|uniref:tyrosine-protein phosphatase n=1 Tax=Bacillus sp. B1-b2 TaxID=2653201 RepID=UPI001261CB6A|nr:tyrosine-protein phosphatase [Bacillus sp. B1-b2]KAB7668351.1 tyrosine-protein phosphatase [Bacillus sp. B1-b2]